MAYKLCAVIMCGGSGTRFWPASRRDLPKQFLRFRGGTSLIQDTVARLEGLVPKERIFLLAAESHAALLEKHLPDIPRSNYILEPAARNTGPALALAARRLEEIDAHMVMAALPADHAIEDIKAFQANISTAASHAFDSRAIVTVGITPNAPETGYGYIELGEECGKGVKNVIRFVEKPPLEKALEYLNGGRHVWNGGIFVVRVDQLAASFKEFEPTIYKTLWNKVPGFNNAGHDARLRELYPQLPKVSIDYAVMEKAEEVACVPAQFDWNDLGAWNTLEKFFEKDKAGNAANGRYYSIESTGNVISRGSRDIALIGVDDLVVVERDDVILVCAKERSQEVRELIALLEREEREDLL